MIRTKEEWAQILEDQKNSGMSVQEYCEHHRINIKTYYNHHAKKKPQKDSIQLIPVRVKPETQPTQIKVNGVELQWDTTLNDQELQRVLRLCKDL